jgi:predicted small secreted protein
MQIHARHMLPIVALALAGLTLTGCGTMNERLAAGVGDAIPAWAGGMPVDAPPRPGTAKYDEFMRERERRRMMPAAEREREDAQARAAATETARPPE